MELKLFVGCGSEISLRHRYIFDSIGPGFLANNQTRITKPGKRSCGFNIQIKCRPFIQN